MKYWPLSMIANDRRMPWAFAGELYQVQVLHKDVLTPPAIQACGHVANNTPGRDMPNLEVIQNPEGVPRRVFRGYPEFDEWMALERTGICLAPDGMLYVVLDALH
jgi:hypothetical protein